jgi:very-short-patch-repair endonuclease
MSVVRLSDALQAWAQRERKMPFRPVNGSLSLSDRFRNIKANYAEQQRRVDAGLATWDRGDVYALGNWISLFTPIEAAAWSDIRSWGLPLWPQLPVGCFFVDFGNPVLKVALECDGRQWHDAEKDAARDEILEDAGWLVFRAPGWRCMKTVDRPVDWDYLSDEQRQELREYRHLNTMDGLMRDMQTAMHWGRA